MLVPRALRRLKPLQRRLHERRALLPRTSHLTGDRTRLLHLRRCNSRCLPNPSSRGRTLLSITALSRRRRFAADNDAVDLPTADV